MKETIVSYAVARDRNICQTCLNDMKYGLPVGVRDSLLAQAERQVALPTSDVGTRYHYQQLAGGGGGGELVGSETFALDVMNQGPARQLDIFARAQQAVEARSKTAFRNLPKLCSFWVLGGCTRVLKKSCPFRPCCGTFAFPEIAGGATRALCQKLIEMLNAEGPAEVQKKLDAETKEAFSHSKKGNKDEAIRKRVSGEDDLSRKYLGKMKSMHMELALPEDPSIATLWLGNVEQDISEGDIRDAIYQHGQVQGIHGKAMKLLLRCVC